MGANTVPLDTLIFDASSCGFPRPRVSPLPVGIAGLSPNPRHEPSWAPAAHFRHFTRGRYALREAYRLAGIGPGATLLAPSYHCRTMLDPALALGGEVQLYPLRQDLSPAVAVLDELLAQSPTPVRALLVTHFFGIPQPLQTLSSWCAAHGITLIEDCSHALFCEQHRPPGIGRVGDFVIGSPYKFFPAPDGGLLYARQAERLADVMPHRASLVDELRGIAHCIAKAKDFRQARKACDPACVAAELTAIARHPGQQARALNLTESCSADYHPGDEQLASLRFSRRVYRHADIEGISRRRRDNYRRWTQATSHLPFCRPLVPQLPEGCIPYMFPLYIDRPEPDFDYLKRLGVPAWRWDSIAVSTCPTANDYRLHLLHLPCHQALDERQLDWLIAAIRKVGVTEGNPRGTGEMAREL